MEPKPSGRSVSIRTPRMSSGAVTSPAGELEPPLVHLLDLVPSGTYGAVRLHVEVPGIGRRALRLEPRQREAPAVRRAREVERLRLELDPHVAGVAVGGAVVRPGRGRDGGGRQHRQQRRDRRDDHDAPSHDRRTPAHVCPPREPVRSSLVRIRTGRRPMRALGTVVEHAEVGRHPRPILALNRCRRSKPTAYVCVTRSTDAATRSWGSTVPYRPPCSGARRSPYDAGRVIVYDRRGCTRSERPLPFSAGSTTHVEDAAALLGALKAGPATVIGRSYGGAVAIELALRHPERVRSSCWKRSSDCSFPTQKHGRPSWPAGWKRWHPLRTTPSRWN